MTNLNETSTLEVSAAQTVLLDAIEADVPIVAILGQSLGQEPSETDRICLATLERLGIKGSSWNDIFDAGALSPEFYGWLNERFERRSPTPELASIGDAHFSAVFTSSFDPVLKNLFATDGREPEPVLVGDPPPPISRSKLRPRIFYLFGMTGAGKFQPPTSRLDLRARLAQHATPMLNTMFDIATPLGIIVVDGLRAGNDWLNPSVILGQLSRAPTEGVLWFGPDPCFDQEDSEIFAELVDRGIVLRDPRPLGVAIAEAEVSKVASKLQAWNEPGIVSFKDGKRLVTTPSLRLSTEASASIVDDAWMDHLEPLDTTAKAENFALFHSIPSSTRPLFEGIRRGYAIERDFEQELAQYVRKALNNHAGEKGAIVLRGQSGIGKSIALCRLAEAFRKDKSAAVLFARDRIPLAVELAAFLSEVDKLDQVTLLIADALAAPKRYDTLLESFRSRGHRIVVVGTSYSTDLNIDRHNGRLLEAAARLSDREREALLALRKRFSDEVGNNAESLGDEHALAQFFWMLPQSRSRLARGLGREARSTERVLRHRGQSRKTAKPLTTMAQALLKAGYRSEVPILTQENVAEEQNDAAGRLIDIVMACSRVHRWVPVNLVLRALVSDQLISQSGIDTELIRDLFDGNDLFRWRYHDNTEDQLLIGARLQLEAQLICDQRLGGPVYEAQKILDLISCATRAGPEGSEETRFVADIVYALGPDGPLGERYHQSYGTIANTLTTLRRERGVRNARLMLQEATLRRHYIRRNEFQISNEEQARILDEAREAVEEALSETSTGSHKLRAGRRTIEHLWVERAATYGFLATAATKRGEPSDAIWANYIAARQATQNAAGKVDTYYPLDISLWIPLQLLEAKRDLGTERETELRADIMSTIDMVNEDELDADQSENFQRQRLRAGGVIGDFKLGDEAFLALDKVGSSAGYYFRAKKLAPLRTDIEEPITAIQLEQAKTAAEYLLSNKDSTSEDQRCMRLLLDCLWLWKTKSWLLRGLRQPIPATDTDRSQILEALMDLSVASGGELQPKFKYLIAVLGWLTGDERGAIRQFRELASETEYVEGKRVLPRNVITDTEMKPVAFSGVVERRIGELRWSVHVRELNRRVDLLEGRWIRDVSIGKQIPEFSIAFNYLGPIAVRMQ